MPLALVGQIYFCLVLEASALSLTISLAINKAEFIDGEVAVCFSE